MHEIDSANVNEDNRLSKCQTSVNLKQTVINSMTDKRKDSLRG